MWLCKRFVVPFLYQTPFRSIFARYCLASMQCKWKERWWSLIYTFEYLQFLVILCTFVLVVKTQFAYSYWLIGPYRIALNESYNYNYCYLLFDLRWWLFLSFTFLWWPKQKRNQYLFFVDNSYTDVELSSAHLYWLTLLSDDFFCSATKKSIYQSATMVSYRADCVIPLQRISSRPVSIQLLAMKTATFTNTQNWDSCE